MDEARESRIEVEIHQEKVDFINSAYEKELRYWKRAAFESVSAEAKVAKELIESTPRRGILVRKVKNVKIVNIDEIFFYLKSHYSAHINQYNWNDIDFPAQPSKDWKKFESNNKSNVLNKIS